MKIRNPKSEIRNKFKTMENRKTGNPSERVFICFPISLHSDLFRISDFGFRIFFP